MINLSREYFVPTALYNISLSLGILVALWLFASTYINFVPGGVSVLARLSTLTLTLFLALLGSVGWIIAPPYIKTYHPDLVDHQTLRFTPSSSGGYTVTSIDFDFKTELGERLQVQPTNEDRNHKIDFVFPFYGQTYTEVYAASSGVIGMGEPFWQPNMQARCPHLPAIFPLMIDLDPNVGGGLYARQEPDRLILTWDHLPALYRTEAVFTFQAVLYQDGVFDITTNGLPLPFRFDPDETPSANPWMRGAVPGRGECIHISTGPLLEPQEGQRAIVQNYHLDFRQHLHAFMLPLAWVVIGGSLLLLLGLPTLLQFAVVRPLDTLAAGVRRMEAGDLDVQVPVHSQDEIGFVTNAFNVMASRLGELVTGLEERVAERTSELAAEMEAREQAQAQILKHQRALATLEERERLGRELHDGLGQVMGYVNVQAQAVETLLAENKVKSAQEAQADIRGFILGLCAEDAPRRDFWQALCDRLDQFQAAYGIETGLSLPDDAPLPAFGPAVEEQLLHIIQEALTNAHKHAAARRVEVLVSLDAAAAIIVIADDGAGFTPSPPAPLPPGARGTSPGEGTHFGLQMMRERAAAVGGQVEVRSTPG